MGQITLQGVHKSFGQLEIIKDANLDIADGSFVVFVGPSGCGKTTLLRLIAGLEDVTGGQILIDGQNVVNVPPAKRGLSMVFQSYALYPHMSVRGNIAFGLKMAGLPRPEINRKVEAAAATLNLTPYLDRKPRELSGGQRQRVAIGRAIVREPKAFLFDEPLSNLDAALRVQMRLEVTKLQKQLATTAIYVTHDQVEALTLADRIAVMDGGKLRQYGTPDEVYQLPANTGVARFIGSPSMNLIAGQWIESADNLAFQGSGITIPFEAGMSPAAQARPGMLTLGIRPEGLSIEPRGLPLLGMGRVYAVEPLGSDQFLHVTYGGDGAELIKVRARPDARFEVGDAITLNTSPADIYLFDSTGERIFPNDLRW